jgi:hypothetical protein
MNRIETINNTIKKNDEIYNKIQSIYNAKTNEDTADDHRMMRDSKQHSNHNIALEREKVFIQNNIKYELGNHVIVITHPITQTKIRRSLIKNKTYYKNIWRDNITIPLIIAWYNAQTDIIDELY